MNSVFVIALLGFIIVSTVMILIILVQRPSGGGLAGAFGGAGATSSESVFGGRVGDVLTNVTIGAFVAYLGLAITLTLVKAGPEPIAATPTITAPGLPGDAPGNTVQPGLEDMSDLSPEDRARLQEAIKDIEESGRTVPDRVKDASGTPTGTFDPGTLDFDDPSETDDDLSVPAGTSPDGGTP
jgi:protein translocase SecG subunit